MKKISIIALGLVSAFAFSSCMTTYDAYGRPVQSVDPGTAAVGVVAAGLIGASIANNNDHPRRYRHYREPYRHYHRPAPYYYDSYHRRHR